MNAISLARELIKIPSPSGSESKLGFFLKEILEKYFQVRIQKVGSSFNLLAFIGKPDFLFTTHIDTVPCNIDFKEDSLSLYGRGAVDTKGLIASMIFAAIRAKESGLSNFGILFDVGEESDFCGIKKAVNLVKPQFVVVGEPTNFKLVIGQKGLLGLKINSFGKSCHGSNPSNGICAISKLVDFLADLKKLALPINNSGSNVLNIGLINGGFAINVVPDYASCSLEFRTTVDNKVILDLIKSLVKKFNLEFEVLSNFNPVFASESRFIKQLSFEQKFNSAFSEIYFWSGICPVIEFGPGNPEFAHTDVEMILKKDILRGVDEYFSLIETYKKSYN